MELPMQEWPRMKLATCRARRYWTRAQLAKESGVAVRTIRNIEEHVVARPQLTVVQRLATALQVDPAEIDEFRAVLSLD